MVKDVKSTCMYCQHVYKHLKASLLALLYPQCCLYCHHRAVEPDGVFCHLCSKQLFLLQAQGRCCRCFTLLEEGKMSCHLCRFLPAALTAAVATCAYTGPAAALVKKLKYSGLYYLAKGMGALMVTQLLQQAWPWPDYVIPTPMAASHLLRRGYNQSVLLAHSMSELINRPVCIALGRYSGDYSQAGLTREQRLALNCERFILLEGTALRDKNILIIDDVWTTGQTMACCASVLARANPRGIYGLSFCRTVE